MYITLKCATVDYNLIESYSNPESGRCNFGNFAKLTTCGFLFVPAQSMSRTSPKFTLRG